jgi:dipeptidyl aminopeptidase/acylaminoacyl peptidase
MAEARYDEDAGQRHYGRSLVHLGSSRVERDCQEIHMPPRPYPFERYLNVRSAWGASFSPDGSRLSFLSDITGVAEVWSVPVPATLSGASTPWPEQVTFRGERVDGATYSPGAHQLLVRGDVGGNEHHQLFAVSGDGTVASELTARPEVIHQFGGWSPDGTRICYASNERDSRYFDVYQRRIDGGEPRVLLAQDGTNYAAGYAPDGQRVLVVREESNVRNSILLVDVASGRTRVLLEAPATGHGHSAQPAWSADGSTIYLLDDRGREFAALAQLDVATGELTTLRDEPWDAEDLAVSVDGGQLALVTNVDGYSRLELFDIGDGWEARRELPVPELRPGVVREVTWSRDGRRLDFTLEAGDANPDVWVWDVSERALWQATHSARGGIAADGFVAPTLARFPTFDRREIPTFLFLPPGREARGLPVVVYVHGGPESQFRPSFNPILQYLVNSGYAVLAPNVRGSTGYGHNYQSLDDVRLRMDSVADLKAAVEWLAETGTADPQRIAIFGRSYGGFMVLAAVTTFPDLWAAAVDIVGIANFVTFLERTGPWRRPLRESEYGSLERDRDFLEAISPIHKVADITAPLFVLHGANDARVPVSEAEQIVAALRDLDRPVESLIFPDEGHQFTKRSTQLAAYPAVARFLARHLGLEADGDTSG